MGKQSDRNICLYCRVLFVISFKKMFSHFPSITRYFFWSTRCGVSVVEQNIAERHSYFRFLSKGIIGVIFVLSGSTTWLQLTFCIMVGWKLPRFVIKMFFIIFNFEAFIGLFRFLCQFLVDSRVLILYMWMLSCLIWINKCYYLFKNFNFDKIIWTSLGLAEFFIIKLIGREYPNGGKDLCSVLEIF